jgi:N-acetylglucosamine malate deacetylase 1
MNKTVLAVGAHPDDIEIMMGGTVILLRQAGCVLHYMNLTDGDCGSETYSRAEIGEIRTREAMNACARLEGIFHPSLTHDMEIFYEDAFIRKLAAVVREVKPDIIITQSLEDYMFDHINTAKLMISAAFVRGAPNYASIPAREAISRDVAIYHAMPYGLKDMTRREVVPDFFVDIEEVMDEKKSILAEHKSQREWLRASQGIDSYIIEMKNMCKKMGGLSKRFKLAEAFSRHSHLGYGPEKYNPLVDLLKNRVVENS